MMLAATMSAVYYVGNHPAVAAALRRDLQREVVSDFPSSAAAGDLVFLSTRSSPDLLPGGNAFSACRRIKENPAVRVWLLVDRDDPYAAEIARFCLADGVLPVAADGTPADLSPVSSVLRQPTSRAPTDAMLERLERELARDRGGRATTVQRMLDERRDESLIDLLTDPATGLFAAPFASLKLEEEFKRAMRFHQPLSLVLLDIGTQALQSPSPIAARESLLAEIAAVFLNECRDIDVLARFTETTFLFLLPGTGSAGAATVARRMVAELRTRPSLRELGLDPRAGLATVPASGIEDRGEFLARAETCLARARSDPGGSAVCASSE